ncbi:FA71D protein, partial [Brachypteracias leptosomus]|nr:FA71D protein [Brachypteracias leptosomus]
MNRKCDLKRNSSSQVSVMADLQRLLRTGEYAPFTSPPILESKFVQVNKRGEPISLHNQPSYVIIGICAANPSSPMPDAMLVACQVPMSPQESETNFLKLSEEPSYVEELVLTRFFPLKFVELSVHSTDNHHLLLKLVTGRCYYLELCAPPDQQQHLFHLWMQQLSLLKPPENICNTKVGETCKDLGVCCKKGPSPNNPPKNKVDPQDVPNPKTKEEVTKQMSSNQILLSSTMGPTEESERKGNVICSSSKTTRQETTMQTKNIDPLDTKKSRSTEEKKTR